MWEYITRLQKEKKYYNFLTTHYIDEAKFAIMIAIMDNGNNYRRDTPANFKRRYTKINDLQVKNSDSLRKISKEKSRIKRKRIFFM